ncbi:hypothetical protein [Sulfurihydrogenibium subterraneum]|uniref:hypothetical protein n=1 Tax=Sulfurihydrogenibium subterraneum TaxID=171121 RepID=UPI001FDF4C19|nr:hypothetical protein [Sulfurihydrogenibium subterraneum]
MIYRQTYQETQKHIDRLKNAFNTLKDKGFLPLDEEKIDTILEDDYLLAILDQIVYRFSKLQDSLAKLVKSYLYIKGENVENLTMVDILNKLEKLELGITKEKWFELRELRNILVHEYEDEKYKIAKTFNKIYDEINFFENFLGKLKDE